MRNGFIIATTLAAIAAAVASLPARAAQLQSIDDCTPGKRVVTSDRHRGTITRVDRAWSYCYVRQDDTGKEVSYLYSVLETEGPTNEKLVIGNYNCWIGGDERHRQNVAGEMRVASQTTYQVDSKNGTLRLDPSGMIVFETGPYSAFHGKLLSGHRIGINQSGGTFYNMTCDPAGR
jgi:hypothetical protein